MCVCPGLWVEGVGCLMMAGELVVLHSIFMKCVYSGCLEWVPRINLDSSGSEGGA